ncbi:MAG: hypothetical protein EOP38_01290 [Rubrivivax sp.]|nr:MAG: hypothetical protein EOP38_01290 [Rubrivivax sp.]
MKAFKMTAAAVAIGVSGVCQAERLVNWQVEGHITSIDLAMDPTYAALWSKLQVGQSYVATFHVDLDAWPGDRGDYSPARDSTLEFKEAGLKFQLNFINGGIFLSSGGLDMGWGYGARQGDPSSPGVAYSFGGFSRQGGASALTLDECNDAIHANGWVHPQPIHFGFVGEELTSLGTFVHASVDRLTTSAVPETDAVALALAGIPLCLGFKAVQRRAGAPRSSHPAQ